MNRLDTIRRIVDGDLAPVRSAENYQRPILYYPGLRSQPFYDLAEFPWIDGVKDAVPALRDELNRARAARAGFEPVFPKYSDSGRWAVAWLFLYGQAFDDNCRRFPVTVDVLQRVPRLAGWACYSALAPKAHIHSHCGVTNAKLRLHLAISSDAGSRMRVGDRTYEWCEGEAMVFDDSYEHEVWCDSESPRIVLILDFYHPDLSDEEVAFLCRFEAEPSTYLGGRSPREVYVKTRSTVDAGDVGWLYDGHSTQRCNLDRTP